MALLKDQDVAAYTKMMDLMMGDVKDTALRELSAEISKMLRGDTRLDHLTEDEVATYQGIKSTNSVHTQDRETSGSVLYHTYCLINHSCHSNTRSDMQSDGSFKMKVYAQRPIQEGEEVHPSAAVPAAEAGPALGLVEVCLRLP